MVIKVIKDFHYYYIVGFYISSIIINKPIFTDLCSDLLDELDREYDTWKMEVY